MDELEKNVMWKEILGGKCQASISIKSINLSKHTQNRRERKGCGVKGWGPMSDASTTRRAEGSTPRADLLRTTMVVR